MVNLAEQEQLVEMGRQAHQEEQELLDQEVPVEGQGLLDHLVPLEELGLLVLREIAVTQVLLVQMDLQVKLEQQAPGGMLDPQEGQVPQVLQEVLEGQVYIISIL